MFSIFGIGIFVTTLLFIGIIVTIYEFVNLNEKDNGPKK